MTEEEAGRILGEQYAEGLAEGRAMLMLYDFGIRYADEIASMDINAVLRNAGISENLRWNLRHAGQLGKYLETQLGRKVL